MLDDVPPPEGEDEFIFNEYAIDDTLDPLNRLLKYHTSDFSLQRLVLIRELTDTANFAGFPETVSKILPLLNSFVADSEPGVRQMLVQQLFPLAEFCIRAGGEPGYQQLLGSFLHFAFELLVDKNVEVGNAAVAALIKLAGLVRAADVETELLHVVTRLAHDERAEDYRVVAAQLFNELAPIFGAQLCRQTVLDEVTTLSTDMSFSVRKTVGSCLGHLCTVLGKNISTEKILPIYLKLCKDDIWGVRKACAESIVQVSEGVTNEARVQQLIPVFKLLSEDASRWVRVAAYQNLGQFIHTMPREDISIPLLKMFTDMAFQSEGGDSDFAEYCAFSFPAVVEAIGRERWKEVDDAFSTLVKDVQWKVRKSLAHSLHEIARLAGQQISERTLAIAFEMFLRDLDEVKYGCLLSVGPFFESLSPGVREKYTPLVCAVPLETENWRLRNLVASKIGDVAVLISPKVIAAHITDLVLKLLDDSVMEVRLSTYHSTAKILNYLSTQEPKDVYLSFLEAVGSFSKKLSFFQRQIFAYIFQQLLEINATTVVEALADRFCALASDPISNVRIVVGRILSMTVVNHPTWKKHAKLSAISKKLAEDEERDVRAIAKASLPRPTDPARAAAYR